MSNVISDEPVVAATSSEVDQTSEETGKKSILETITVYDTMLILSFIFIAMATLRLFLAIRTYSDTFPLGGFPWRTSEFLNVLMW